MNNLTINTDEISILMKDVVHLDTAQFMLFTEDPEDDQNSIDLHFKIRVRKTDINVISVSRGVGENKEVFGKGQGGKIGQIPKEVMFKAYDWLIENKNSEEYVHKDSNGIIHIPQSMFK